MHFRLYMKKNDVLKHIDADDAARDFDLMEGLQSSSQQRFLPPVCLGHAATDASHKYSALLHSISLETGPARDQYLQSVLACTTDQGTWWKVVIGYRLGKVTSTGNVFVAVTVAMRLRV